MVKLQEKEKPLAKETYQRHRHYRHRHPAAQQFRLRLPQALL
jgi:hypothetical protein